MSGAEARAVLASKREAVRERRLKILIRLLEKFPLKTNKEIASMLEVAPETISRYLNVLRERGVEIPRRGDLGWRSPRERKEARIGRLIELINENPDRSAVELGKILGVSRSVVNDYIRILKSRGVVPRHFALKGEAETRRERERRERRPTILRGIREDRTYGDIAESLGVTPQRIAQDIKYMRKAGDSGLERALKEREQLRAKRRPKRRRPADLEAAADRFLVKELGLSLEWVNRLNMAAYYSEALLYVAAGDGLPAEIESADQRVLRRNKLIKYNAVRGPRLTWEASAALFTLGFRHPRPFRAPKTTTSQNGRMVREGIPTPRVTSEKNP